MGEIWNCLDHSSDGAVHTFGSFGKTKTLEEATVLTIYRKVLKPSTHLAATVVAAVEILMARLQAPEVCQSPVLHFLDLDTIASNLLGSTISLRSVGSWTKSSPRRLRTAASAASSNGVHRHSFRMATNRSKGHAGESSNEVVRPGGRWGGGGG